MSAFALKGHWLVGTTNRFTCRRPIRTIAGKKDKDIPRQEAWERA